MSFPLRFPIGGLIATLTLIGVGGLAFADDAPSPEEIMKALQAKPDRGVAAATAGAVETDAEEARLIADLKRKAARGLSVDEVEGERLAEVLPAKPKIDLEINFELNSADVTDTNRPVITALGRALQSDNLKDGTFVIAGHTDKSGSASYNKKLSARRAESIRRYLIDNFALKGEQLIVVGYGHERPKNKKNPYSPDNRRAEIVTVESASVAQK